MTKTKLLLLIAMTLLFSGCAITNHVIEQSYQPTLKKIEGSEKYSVFTKVNFQPVFINDPKAIGVKKNGYGSETARIYLFENVEDWLKKGFDQELNAAGFNVANSQNNKIVKITLDVRQFFIEPWVGFWSCDLIGTLKIEAKVELPNNDLYYVRKFVAYDKLTTMVWPDSLYETRILNVAQKSIPEIVREIHLLFIRNI